MIVEVPITSTSLPHKKICHAFVNDENGKVLKLKSKNISDEREVDMEDLNRQVHEFLQSKKQEKKTA